MPSARPRKLVASGDGRIIDGKSQCGAWYVQSGEAGGWVMSPRLIVFAWRDASGVARAGRVEQGRSGKVSKDALHVTERIALMTRRASGMVTRDQVDFGALVRQMLAMVHSGTRRAGDGDEDRGFRSRLSSGATPPRATTKAVSAFLATLDPDAVEAIATLPPSALAHWEGLDATFTPGAPLRRALSALPDFGETLVASWARDRVAFIADMTHDDPWAVVRRKLASEGLPRWLVAALPDACAAGGSTTGGRGTIAYMDIETQAERIDRETFSGAPSDMIVRFASRLADMGPDRLPRGPQWMRCADALRIVGATVLRDVEPELVPGALGLSGADWAACVDGLAHVAGASSPAMIVSAIRDAEDRVRTYARQVVSPALGIAGVAATDMVAERLARHVLHSGRTARAWILASRRWHARRAAIDAAVADLPGARAADPPWRPWLPPFSMGNLRLVPLLTVADLVDEGRDGPDPCGIQGLGHCVGGYGDRCRRGELRILGVRRVAPDGTIVRLSTLEVAPGRTGGVDVGQHRGPDNDDPPPEADAFVKAYAAHLTDLPRAMVAADLAPLPGAVDDPAGYDWGHEGNWRRVRDLWAPCLPRAARGWEPGDFAGIMDAARNPGWSPVTVVRR